MAFRNRSVENMTPIRPQIFLIDEQPVIGYRRFRFRGNKTFGWDLFLSRFDTTGWGKPVRVSESYGMLDTGFAVLPTGKTVFAACDQASDSMPCVNHRVILAEIVKSFALPDIEIPARNKASYVYPASVRDIAPAPLRPTAVPDQYYL